MCMIAHRFLSKRGQGQNMPNEVISTACTRHPDGYGIAWRDPIKGLRYERFGPSERLGFRDSLKRIDADRSIEYVAHFRFATHGPEDRDHAHPFAYQDPDPKIGRVLVFHNGIISGMRPEQTESDTEVFVRDYLAKLPSAWWRNAGVRKLVDHMGGWSRLVLMTDHETVNLNHYAGDEAQGLWYSSDHKPTTWTAMVAGAQSWNDEEEEDWQSAVAANTALALSRAASPRSSIGVTTIPTTNAAAWVDSGHRLQRNRDFDFLVDGDFPNGVSCVLCSTDGDVYIIDGKAYIDITHVWGPAARPAIAKGPICE